MSRKCNDYLLRRRISTMMWCRGFPTKRDLGEEQYDDIQPGYDCGGLLFDNYPLVDLVMVMVRPWELGLQQR